MGLLAEDLLGVCLVSGVFAKRKRLPELLADGLQRVQSSLDVSDLRRQDVDGLHGAVQLLATRHQRVHALRGGQEARVCQTQLRAAC